MNFSELYTKLIESQQLEFDFNAKKEAVKLKKAEEPERVYSKWMISCATKKVSTAALYKRFHNILKMKNSSQKRYAFDCFMHWIMLRLIDLGFRTKEQLEDQGVPEYKIINRFYFRPGKRCKPITWH